MSFWSSVLGAIPVVGQVAGIAEGIYNASQQSSVNAQQMKMMLMQRQWSLEDRDYQNQYNSPQAVMQRLKDANLNPNLVLGQGNAIQTAAVTRPTPNASLQAPQLAVADSMLKGFLAMYDLQKTQADTDRIKAQEELIRSMIRNKDADTGLKTFDLGFKKDAAPFQLGYLDTRNNLALKQGRNLDAQYDQTLQNIKNAKANEAFTIAQNTRNAQTVAQQLKESATRILKMRAETEKTTIGKQLLLKQIESLDKDVKLKKWAVQLSQSGLTPSDPAAVRLANKALDDILDIQY